MVQKIHHPLWFYSTALFRRRKIGFLARKLWFRDLSYRSAEKRCLKAKTMSGVTVIISTISIGLIYRKYHQKLLQASHITFYAVIPEYDQRHKQSTLGIHYIYLNSRIWGWVVTLNIRTATSSTIRHSARYLRKSWYKVARVICTVRARYKDGLSTKSRPS